MMKTLHIGKLDFLVSHNKTLNIWHSKLQRNGGKQNLSMPITKQIATEISLLFYIIYLNITHAIEWLF